jgi:hypothetical protein
LYVKPKTSLKIVYTESKTILSYFLTECLNTFCLRFVSINCPQGLSILIDCLWSRYYFYIDQSDVKSFLHNNCARRNTWCHVSTRPRGLSQCMWHIDRLLLKSILFLCRLYEVVATYRDHFSVVCLSVTKLVRTTPHKLLVQFHPNFRGMINTKSCCALSICLSVCHKTCLNMKLAIMRRHMWSLIALVTLTNHSCITTAHAGIHDVTWVRALIAGVFFNMHLLNVISCCCIC